MSPPSTQDAVPPERRGTTWTHGPASAPDGSFSFGWLDDGTRWAVRALVPVWLVSRMLLLVVALTVKATQHRSLHDLLSAWDVAHFEAIASHGYVEPIDRAFFPGLPLLLKGLGGIGLPMGVAGVLIAAVTSFLGALALVRMGFQRGRSLPTARTAGLVAAGLWLVAPTTVFTSVAYTEAPFCAAAFWAWQRATQRRWGQAALLTAVACTFRISGLFLVGGLGLLALTQRHEPWGKRLRDAAIVAFAAVTLVAYVVYLHHLTGSWNAWFEAQQSGWNRGFTNPLDSLQHTLDATDPTRWPGRPDVGLVFRAEVVSMAVGVVVTVLLLWRRRWAEAGYVGVQVFAFATSYWFMSVNRAVLLWFPVWLLVAELAAWAWAGSDGVSPERDDGMLPGRPDGLSTRRAVGRFAVVVFGVVSAVVMVWWAWQYFTGSWAS